MNPRSNYEAIQHKTLKLTVGMSQERLCKHQVSSKSVRVMFFCVDLTWNDPYLSCMWIGSKLFIWKSSNLSFDCPPLIELHLCYT